MRRLLVDTKKYTWSNCAVTVATSLGLRVRPDVAAADETASNEKVDVLGMQTIVTMATHRYLGGDYASTLSLLARLPSRGVPTEIYLQADLLRAETYTRLNRYAEAQGLVSKLRPSLRKSEKWTHVLQCLGIENTVSRDKGDYAMAVDTGREAVAIAGVHCPAMVGSSRRKLARSLALAGDWQKALSEGEMALAEARKQSQIQTIDEAKALLAIGEANRHGFRQDEAVKAYGLSRTIALNLGHADCLLWASLGLADSRFLLGEIEIAAEILTALQNLSRQESYPLENLHCELSLMTIKAFRPAARAQTDGIPVDEHTRLELETAAENLIARYEKLGIEWPRQYLRQQVLQGDFSFPKRF